MDITGVIKEPRHHILAVEEARLLFTPLELQGEGTGKEGVIIIDPETLMDQIVFRDHLKATMEREVREVVVAGIGKTEAEIEDQLTEVVE